MYLPFGFFKTIQKEGQFMSNKIKLSVGGIEYMVVTDDDEAHVRKIGAKLNEELDRTKKANPRLSTTMVAVLTALDMCDELDKSQKECEQLRLQLKKAVEDSACTRFDGEEARREIERLTGEIKALKQ